MAASPPQADRGTARLDDAQRQHRQERQDEAQASEPAGIQIKPRPDCATNAATPECGGGEEQYIGCMYGT